MDPGLHQNDLKWLRRANARLALGVLALAAMSLVSLSLNVKLVGSERTIVVPPTIERSFWVDRNRISREYLEQMTEYLVWLGLDVNPFTVQRRHKLLLSYVGPEHGQLKAEMDLQATRLRSTNASTSFEIQQLIPDEQAKSVLVTGRLRRQINGDDIGEPRHVAYRVRFDYAHGRLSLVEFKEVPRDEAAKG